MISGICRCSSSVYNGTFQNAARCFNFYPLSPLTTMEMKDHGDIFHELAKQLLRSDISESALVSASRLLRPASSDVSMHSDAVRLRLRRFLLSKYGEDSGGPSAVMDFDREVDALRKMQSPVWQSFLAMLQPLSLHRQEQENPDHRKFRFPLLDDRSKPRSGVLPMTEIEAKSSALPLSSPPDLIERELLPDSHKTLWVSDGVESLLLRDLLLIFQVC